MPLGLASLLPFAVLALAAPLVLAAAPRGRRALAAAIVTSMALAHAGLYVLYWSRTLCWILVGTGAVAAAVAAFPRRAWAVGAVAAAASLAAGLAFEATPGDAGIFLYVGGAGPLLLAAALAAASSRWLAHDASFASRAMALGVLAFAALIPLTSFWPSFLLTFEPFHAPLLALALAGLALLARRVWRRADSALRVESIGHLAFAPPRAAPPLALSLLALGGTLALAAYAAGGLHLGRLGALPLVLSSLAAVPASFAVALSLARARSVSLRAEAVSPGPGRYARGALASVLPPRALVEQGAPTRSALEALSARLRAEGAPLAVLVARAPPGDPFWTLDDDAYAWLLAQPSGPGVHVAIVEGDEVSFVPPALEGLSS